MRLLRRFQRLTVVLLAAALVATGAMALLAPAPAWSQDADGDPILAALEPLIQALRYLDAQYYRDLDLGQLVRGAIQGVLDVLDDPNTVYYEPSAYEDLQVDLGGSYTGVGLYIQERDGYIVIQSPIPGSPAQAAGLQPGDRILAVDGRDVVGERSDVVAGLVRGPEGTTVTLTIQRGSQQPFDVRLQRARIELPSVEARIEGGDIGYIRVYQFYSGVGEKVRAAYDKFAGLGMKGVVLDLRDNPGGLLTEAVDMARAFVPRGPVVHIVSAGGRRTTYDARPGTSGPPVAVLVNGGTASASEIVAAAIQESGAGFLVGSRTFGKGTVQTIVEFRDGSGFKFTTAEYLSPSGRSIDGVGLEPDVAVGPQPVQEPAFSPLSGRFVLERGSRGIEVEGLQQRLAWLGYDPGPVDGVFGSATQAALQAFQQAHRLPVTGRLDAQTARAVEDAIALRLEGMGTGDAAQGDEALQRALELLRSGQWRSLVGG
ncbi:MAG TPA: S41 family peptidase [Bacillota bacterium]